MRDFNDRIERLAELEKHVLPFNWQISETNDENVLDAKGLLVAETCSDDDAALIVRLHNEALPLLREMAQALSEARAENERLRKREAKLKETLLPVCEYAAEIYNRGIPAIPMPDDTIQRLNFAFKMFGG